MSAHTSHRTHPNARLAFWQGRQELFGKRERDILLALRARPESTDREIMLALNLTEPNQTRPRITELLKSGVLEECGSCQDAITGKTVRKVRIKSDPRAPRYRGQVDFSSIVAQLERTA